MRRALLASAAALAVALGAAGCGAKPVSPEAQATETVRVYLAALAAHDYKRACSQVDSLTVDYLEVTAGSCPRALQDRMALRTIRYGKTIGASTDGKVITVLTDMAQSDLNGFEVEYGKITSLRN